MSMELPNLPENENLIGGTTMIVHNIPARYTKSMLIEEWPPAGSYNLLYLPFSFRAKKTLGYAFLNFSTEEAFLKFKDCWDHGRLKRHGRAKPLTMVEGTTQGFWENITILKRSKIGRIVTDRFRPSVFVASGQPVNLQAIFDLCPVPGSDVGPDAPQDGHHVHETTTSELAEVEEIDVVDIYALHSEVDACEELASGSDGGMEE